MYPTNQMVAQGGAALGLQNMAVERSTPKMPTTHQGMLRIADNLRAIHNSVDRLARHTFGPGPVPTGDKVAEGPQSLMDMLNMSIRLSDDLRAKLDMYEEAF